MTDHRDIDMQMGTNSNKETYEAGEGSIEVLKTEGNHSK